VLKQLVLEKEVGHLVLELVIDIDQYKPVVVLVKTVDQLVLVKEIDELVLLNEVGQFVSHRIQNDISVSSSTITLKLFNIISNITLSFS
jgi:hypothetical protein